jgi:hypothetical protein
MRHISTPQPMRVYRDTTTAVSYPDAASSLSVQLEPRLPEQRIGVLLRGDRDRSVSPSRLI